MKTLRRMLSALRSHRMSKEENMDHIIVKAWKDDYLLLVPEKGYRLKFILTGTYQSDAIIKEADLKFFVAEAIV